VTDTGSELPVAFAPEAHLPPERRLLIDGAGVTLETGLGVRHVLPWGGCDGVLVWSDRAELLLNNEVSVVVRASDWHHGREALAAIQRRAPMGLLVPMPEYPEPEPVRYTLRGLATVSSVVLVLLVLSLALVAAVGIGIGAQDQRASAMVVGLALAASTLGVVRSFLIRLHVPRRWRDAAAVRGRTAVALESGIARAPNHFLSLAEPSLYALGGLWLGLVITVHGLNPLPAVLLLGLGFAVRRERLRRSQRTGSM
jgi:hypothetical protein